LAHAIFTRDDTDDRYRDAKGRFKRVEGGEIKTWELSRSIQHLCPDPDDPVRRNVEFFVPLRNMIEHRYARMLEAVVAGRAQSYIVNFEEKVAAEFGQLESLGQALRLPVFLTSLSEDSVAAAEGGRGRGRGPDALEVQPLLASRRRREPFQDQGRGRLAVSRHRHSVLHP